MSASLNGILIIAATTLLVVVLLRACMKWYAAAGASRISHYELASFWYLLLCAFLIMMHLSVHGTLGNCVLPTCTTKGGHWLWAYAAGLGAYFVFRLTRVVPNRPMIPWLVASLCSLLLCFAGGKLLFKFWYVYGREWRLVR
jgi:hypothetical protein